MKKISIIITTFIIFSNSFSQNYNRFWYFGNKAGLDFGINYSNTPPLPLTSNLPSQGEGVATISNNAGTFVAYTDGMGITNNPMNPSFSYIGLGGNFSSAQSGIIIPAPDSNCLFYTFNVDISTANAPLKWSKFRLNQDATITRLFTTAQTVPNTNCAERVYAFKCPISNNTNKLFVISPIKNTNKFVIGVIESGTNTPVFSQISSANLGEIHGTAWGNIKVSPNGRRMAVTESGKDVKIFEINYSGSTISEIRFIQNIELPFQLSVPNYKTLKGVYGIEYSPNSNYLYITSAGAAGSAGSDQEQVTRGHIFCYDYNSNAVRELWNSQSIVPAGVHDYKVGAIQKAPGRNQLYVANPGRAFLGVINNPDQPTATYTHSSIALEVGTICQMGLPNQIYDSVNFGCNTTQDPTSPVPPRTSFDTCILSCCIPTVLNNGTFLQSLFKYSPVIGGYNYRFNDINQIKTMIKIIEKQLDNQWELQKCNASKPKINARVRLYELTNQSLTPLAAGIVILADPSVAILKETIELNTSATGFNYIHSSGKLYAISLEIKITKGHEKLCESYSQFGYKF